MTKRLQFAIRKGFDAPGIFNCLSFHMISSPLEVRMGLVQAIKIKAKLMI